MRMQQVGEPDVPAVATTLALAFSTDPVWSAALTTADGSTDHLVAFWSLFVRGAIGYGTVWMTADAGSVATWIPPDGVELPGSLEEEMFALTAAVLQPQTFAALQELWNRFEANHPHGHPHFYLSLLATHPSQRGRGIGQQLMAANLAEFDTQGVAAYLESTNPANDHRYARAGFVPVGGFDAPINGAHVTTMWREVP